MTHEYIIRYEITNGETNVPEQSTTMQGESAENAEREFRAWFAKEYAAYRITRLTCEETSFE